MSKFLHGTTEQRPEQGLYKGMPFFNDTLNLLEFYNGSVWEQLFSAKNRTNDIDLKIPGIYAFYSTTAEQPGCGAGYANTLVVFKTQEFNSGIQLFFSNADKQVYGRGFDVDTFYPWTLIMPCKVNFGLLNNKPIESTKYKIPIGYCYFATDLGKPIWHKGSDVWVDATGTPV